MPSPRACSNRIIFEMQTSRVQSIIRDLSAHPAGELECQTLEFKSWCRNEKDLSYAAAEAAVCLANADGGLLLLAGCGKRAGLSEFLLGAPISATAGRSI